MEPASSTLLPLVSKIVVPKSEMPPAMAAPPLVMSVVAPEAQRMVPPRAVRPPGLAPKLAEVWEARICSVPVVARVKPPVKVLVPVSEAELPMMATLLGTLPLFVMFAV